MVQSERMRKPRDAATQRAIELMAPLAQLLMKRRPPEPGMEPIPVRDVDVRAMAYLASVDAMPMRDLAALLQVTPGRVTQIIDKLERTGRVHRERDPQDKRIWQVGLTEPARSTVEGYYNRRSSAVEETLDELSPAGRAAVVHFLEGVVSRLSRVEREEELEQHPRGNGHLHLVDPDPIPEPSGSRNRARV
jgi:DNA-binding MarR family transcriptional regulator